MKWFLVGVSFPHHLPSLVLFRRQERERNVCKGHKSSLSEKEETLWLLHQHNIIWNIRRWYTRQTGKRKENDDEKEKIAMNTFRYAEKDMQYVNYTDINYTCQVIMNIQKQATATTASVSPRIPSDLIHLLNLSTFRSFVSSSLIWGTHKRK